MSQREKVSLLLLALDRAAAINMVRRLDTDERGILSASADALTSLDDGTLRAVVDEFERDFARGMKPPRTKADLASIIGDVAASAATPDASAETAVEEPIWPQLGKLKREILATHLAKQHAQVIAFVLSKLDPAQTADLLKLFSGDLRGDIVCRMLTQKRPAPAAEAIVENDLRRLVAAAKETPEAAHGGIAKILNQLDKAETADVIARISAQRPKDASSLKKLLFAFEDLTAFDKKALALVVDRVPVERLVLALNGAGPELQHAVVGAMSPRAQRVAQSELQNAINVAEADIVAARRVVVEAVLKLSAEGAIALGAEGPGQTIA